MPGDWDYNPDLGKSKVTADDVEDVVETKDDEPDFGFDMDEVDEDEDAEGATEESETEPIKKPVGKGTEDAANLQTDKIAGQVLKHVGGKTLVRIKGVEKPLESFSKQEIVDWIQKSARADQVFQEAAVSRRQVDEERRRLEDERARLAREADVGRDSATDRGTTRQGNIPDFLRPGQFDTEEVTALKGFAAEQQQRLDRLEGNFSQNQQKDRLRDIQREVDELGKEYPMASRDEVLAVKLSHPEAQTEELMRLAHNWYCSKDHINSSFKSNPEYKREYDQEVIKQYLARKQTAKKIAGQPVAAGSSSSKVAEKGKIPVRTFEDATKAAHAYRREMARVSEED